MKRPARRIRRLYFGLAVVTLVLAWLLVGRLWQVTVDVPGELLAPTGPFPVGRTSFHWADTSRVHHGPEPGTTCELMVHLWYPANRPAARAAAPYIPGISTIEAAIGKANLKAEAGPAYDALWSARTHAFADADVKPESTAYPVLILTHGLRFSSLGYSMLSEDLASHGYIVVGIDQPSTAFAVHFPDQRVTRFAEAAWTQRRTAEETLAFERKSVDRCGADVMFVIDQLEQLASGAIPSRFEGRLDLGRVGILGHSFGGRVAARACQLDKRLKAGVILDGFGRTMLVEEHRDGSTIQQPMMIQYARRVPQRGIARVFALLQTPGRDLEEELRSVRIEFCESVKAASYEVTLNTPGIAHESFSDMPLLESGQSDETTRNRSRAMEITRSYTRAFFDRYLRAQLAPLLDNAPTNSPEVELTRHAFRGLRPSAKR